ncbi:FUSC family protein [Thermomonas sp.]|uniref:FUSC family protein n=1 Tax=Thermomonas sp. TaxID=1971895 RepID=UPI00248A8B60|nr:FUSC family protein [Thermomonas sp.]MDI1253098.1 FUSC family protein [Thermomonas sp.]
MATTQALARWLQVLPRQQAATHTGLPAIVRESTLRPNPTTRLALQMAVAIAAAFAVGFLVFPQRWAWIVLTAFIVSSGNRGRLDVAYKSVLRVLGAGAGTLAALVFSLQFGSHVELTVALILAAVFLGIWLRPLNYAWWALFVTLALALLQGFEGVSAQAMLLRLEEIAIGALIAVASAWCVYPVRSTDVLRRRIADVLAQLSDAFDPDTPAQPPDTLDAAFTGLDEVAPSFRALRWATSRFKPAQPADWIDTTLACREPAYALIAQQQAPVEIRKIIGSARRALRAPEAFPGALQALLGTLQAAWPTIEDPEHEQAG